MNQRKAARKKARRLRAQRKMRRQRVRDKRCPQCGRPAVFGVFCEKHFNTNRTYWKRHTAKRNSYVFTHPQAWECYGYGARDALSYIGATNDVPRRAIEEQSRKNLKLGKWMAACRRAGIQPQPMTLGFFNSEIEARAAEARLIQIYRAKGHPLLNSVMSEEAIKRLEALAREKVARQKELKKLKEKML